MKKVKNRGYSKTHILLDAKEVIDAIKGTLDWSINCVVLDIIESANDFFSINFSSIS